MHNSPVFYFLPASEYKKRFKAEEFENVFLTGQAEGVFYLVVNDVYLPHFFHPERIQLWYGGAGGGKSDAKATELLLKAITQPYFRLLYLRKFKAQVRYSQFRLFKDLIARYNLGDYFQVRESMAITCTLNNNQLLPGGLDDVDKLKSIPDVSDIWIEEPIDRKGSVKLEDFTELERRLRTTKAANHLHLTFNPVSRQSWVYKVFWQDGMYPANKLKTTYRDNAFLPAEEKDKFERLSKINYSEYLVYGEGEWGGEMDKYRLFEDLDIDDLFTNTFITQNSLDKYLIADIALEGTDRLVLMVWYGWVIVEVQVIEKSDGARVVQIIQETALRHGINGSRIAFDSAGLGGYLKGYLRTALPFIGSAKPLPDERLTARQKRVGMKPVFRNLRAQTYYYAAQAVSACSCFFNVNDLSLRQALSEELSAIQKIPTPDGGPYQIIPKDAIKAAIGRSPDLADCFSMRWIFELERPDYRKDRRIVLG